MARMGRQFRVQQQVKTEFLHGVVLQIVHGDDVGWGHEEYYYLIDSRHSPKPHWVLESEIKTNTIQNIY